MESSIKKCPRCGKMTAQKNLYNGQLICYSKDCCYEQKVIDGKLISVEEEEGMIWFIRDKFYD